MIQGILSALKWIGSQVVTLSIIALVLVAVYVGLGRQFVPMVSHYKSDLEARLSAEAGIPIRIQELKGEWHHFSPIFVAEGIEVLDPAHAERVLVSLPRIETKPAVIASIWNWQPRLVTTLKGLSIELVQDADGRIHIDELASVASDDPLAAKQAVNFFFNQPALILEGGNIGLRLYERPRLSLSAIDFKSLNTEENHVLNGSFKMSESSQAVSFIVNYQGDPTDWQSGHLQAYVSMPELEFGHWLQGHTIANWGVSQAHGGGRYWLDVHNGKLQTLTADLNIRELEITGPRRQQLLPARYQARRLSGVVAWERAETGWRLAANQLRGEFNGLPLPAPQFALNYGAQHIDVAAAQLSIAPLRALLPQLSGLPKDLSNWLSSAGPSGWVPHLSVKADINPAGGISNTHYKAQFKALQFQASTALPGASNLAGWVSGNESGGLLHIDSRQAVLDLHQTFREPVQVSDLRAGVRFKKVADYWIVQSNQLSVANADAKGHGRFSFYLPTNEPERASLQLVASLANGKVGSTWRYVPWKVAGDNTLAWLQRALVKGHLDSAGFLYDGLIKGEHKFQMHFSVRDTEFAFSEDWPAIEKINAEVGIEEGRLSVSSHSAQIYNSQAKNIEADIANLGAPLLVVNADLSSNGHDLMRLFQESALHESVGGVADVIALEGPVMGNLMLSVPLSAKAKAHRATVDINAHLNNNTLHLSGWDLPVSRLTGDIGFSTKKGLVSPELTGQFLNQKMQATIKSDVRQGDLKAVNIDTSGRVSMAALRSKLPMVLFNHMDGQTDYEADIRVSTESHRPPQLIVRSNLEGVRINLPVPLGKGKEAMPMRYVSDLSGQTSRSRLTLGKHINASMVWKKGDLESTRIRVGGDAPAWPIDKGVHIEAKVPVLDVADWQSWSTRNPAKASSAGASGLAVNRFDLEAKEFIAQGVVLSDLKANGISQNNGWNVDFASKRIAGSVFWPLKRNMQADIHIDRFDYPLVQASVAAEQTNERSYAWLTHPVVVNINGLRIAQWPLWPAMTVKTTISPTPFGARFGNLIINNSAFGFSGDAEWHRRGANETRVVGQIYSPNAGKVLKGLGYTPSLTSETATGQVELNWPGEPSDFSLNRVDGKVSAELSDGRLLNMGAVASASRVFGLFDLSNIKRRLRLDFSDVTKEGIAFDSASLNAQIRRGVMSPTHFQFDGPSLTAEGKGRVDLNTGELDQEVKVVVPIGSAVPVAATVVGGPLVGGAVVAAERVLDKSFGKLSALHYHITGDWSDPLVERRQAWGSKQ